MSAVEELPTPEVAPEAESGSNHVLKEVIAVDSSGHATLTWTLPESDVQDGDGRGPGLS